MEDLENKPKGTEYNKNGYSLFIWVADDMLECRCSYRSTGQGAMMTLDDFKELLAHAGITFGLEEPALELFAIKASVGQAQDMVLVASGEPPQHGTDGSISYTAQSSVVMNSTVDDDSGNVDMHNVQTFINVMPNDEIGLISRPQPGKFGRGVNGKIIPPKPGKPVNIKIGKNVRAEDGGCRLVAESAGRICLAGGEISIEDEYVVSGDVNFRIGSIVFNGYVEIRGDVLDDFNIHATKGIRITGNVGVCHLVSNGDIIFCGMDGQEKGSIVCGGSISSQFIHNCKVECSGDVNAEVEIHNSIIKSQGRIIVNKSAISGGEYIALGGVEARKIGSLASVHTKLTVGVDYHDVEELAQLFAELQQNQDKTVQAKNLQEMEGLRAKKAELASRVVAIRSKMDTRANAKVNVKTALYDNTVLSIGSANEVIKEQVDGPVSIIENTIQGGLRFLSMTCLDFKAIDIELAFIREEKLKSKGAGSAIPG